MGRTRITVIFDGAKFDYEVSGSKDEWVKMLGNSRLSGVILRFEDVSGKYVEVDPNKCPILEIESIGG